MKYYRKIHLYRFCNLFVFSVDCEKLLLSVLNITLNLIMTFMKLSLKFLTRY